MKYPEPITVPMLTTHGRVKVVVVSATFMGQGMLRSIWFEERDHAVNAIRSREIHIDLTHDCDAGRWIPGAWCVVTEEQFSRRCDELDRQRIKGVRAAEYYGMSVQKIAEKYPNVEWGRHTMPKWVGVAETPVMEGEMVKIKTSPYSLDVIVSARDMQPHRVMEDTTIGDIKSTLEKLVNQGPTLSEIAHLRDLLALPPHPPHPPDIHAVKTYYREFNGDRTHSVYRRGTKSDLALSARWSAELRRKVEASQKARDEKERLRVVCDPMFEDWE